MTIQTRITSLSIATFVALVPLAACTDDGGADDEIGGETDEADETDETDESGTDETTDGTDDTTDDGTEEDTGTDTGEEKPGLGDTPNVLCEAALANLDMIAAENASGSPDALTIEAAYLDTGLQEFVQYAGAITGRIEGGVLIDDAAILAAIADGSDLAMIDLEWQVYLAMHQFIRAEIADISETLPDPANDPALLYARWDAAWCYYDGAMRSMAQAADAYGLAGDTIEADLDAAFEWGHDGIEGEQPWAIDEWVVGPAKQQVEKTSFAMLHRLILEWAEIAAADDDVAAQRNAYAAFQLIEDRMEGKNTPGIEWVETELSGAPTDIDVAELTRQLNIAFVKRTRKYTDLALPDVGGLMGTAEGYKGAVEGATYSKLVEPFMLEALDGFDLDAYRDSWAAWIQAIADDDVAAGESASAEVTDWNCQYQAALGIAECTSSIDEN